jgi:hypothetical protein|tara:strand:+ start:1068 stop:1892 length:825 start_codon:yes stop_codon:yes gene_type:complete
MIVDLKEIFKSTIKTLEILYVLENKKPAARILVNEDELNNVMDFLNKNDLSCSVSDFKLKKITGNSNYSDKSVKIDKNSGEKGYFSLYISKIKELTEKAKAYEENDMHLELGLILGYPKCCCEFFVKNFNQDNADLTLDVLENSDGFEFSFYTNTAARHFDIALLNHFPCSFNCKSSIEIAKENLEIIKNYSGKLAGLFENTMKNAVLYTNNGIFILKDFKKINNEITFDNILSTTRNEIYDLLINNKKIEIIDKNNIKINNEEIDNAGLMLFT